jgi:hypothetical protein
MRNHDHLEYATATGNDYLAHGTLTMGAIGAVALIPIVMAIFLT